VNPSANQKNQNPAPEKFFAKKQKPAVTKGQNSLIAYDDAPLLSSQIIPQMKNGSEEKLILGKLISRYPSVAGPSIGKGCLIRSVTMP